MIRKQFITLKPNPIRIDLLSDTGDIVDVSSLFCRARKPNPTPNSILNEGPAKLAVVAISGIPFLAMATFADKSPSELPHASTVTPRMGAGILHIVPRNCSSPTRLSPMTSIHVAAIKKPYSDSGA